jgi:hypothetical protein
MSDILKNKMSNYEVLPPEDVWRNIISELDESKIFQPLSEKMYGYEVEAPADSWSNISEALSNEAKAPIKFLNSLYIKLGAAAIVIGVVLVSSLYLFNSEEGNKENTVSNQQKLEPKFPGQQSTAIDPAPDQPSVAANFPTLPLRKNLRLSDHAAIKSSFRQGFRQRRRALTAAAITPRFIDMSKEMNDIIVQGRLIRNERGDIIKDAHIITGGGDDEYISVTGPNGQQTRISSKFADVVYYLNGNEHMQNTEWQTKFKNWRNRIMQTSFIPSSNNFLDILELKDFILEENKQ